MANIYKNEKTSLTTTALTTLYTVPSNSRAIVKSLLVAEDAGSTAVVKVTLVDAAAAIFVVDNDVNLTANQKEQVLSEPLIMKESEILKVQASSGAVDVIASILEINRGGQIMPFVEQEEHFEDHVIDGKPVKVYKPRVEVTIKHLKTGREYMSDAEAQEDVDSPVTDTTQDDISRSVHVKIQGLPLGNKTNL